MGLVTADEFKKARVLAETGVGEKDGGGGGAGSEGGDGGQGAEDAAARKKKKRKKKKLISTLSFGEEIEEDDDAEGGNSGGGCRWGRVQRQQTVGCRWFGLSGRCVYFEEDTGKGDGDVERLVFGDRIHDPRASTHDGSRRLRRGE